MGNLQNAGEGLKKMFIAQIGAIVCTVLMLIPIINILAAIGAIVFAIISLIGLYNAGQDIPGCKTAFNLTIVNLVVSLVGNIIKTGIFATVISIAGDVLALLIVYYLCTSVAEVMKQIGALDVAEKGYTVWKINLVCYVVMIVVAIFSLIPVLNIIAGITGVIIAIVSLIASILYMIFLNKSYQA